MYGAVHGVGGPKQCTEWYSVAVYGWYSTVYGRVYGVGCPTLGYACLLYGVGCPTLGYACLYIEVPLGTVQ